MKFGAHLPTTRTEVEDPLAFMTSYVSDANRLGFEYLAVNDHFLGVFDPVISLAVVAGASGSMQIVPSNMLPIHRGLMPSAKMLAALDLYTGGRVIAGIGPGSQEFEYQINGIPFEDRWRRFEELARSLRSLLSPESEPFRGKYYSTEGVTLAPYPARRPMPIWIGSWGSDAGLRRVARLADGWLASALSTTPEMFRDARGRLNDYLDAAGKDPATFPDALSTLMFYADSNPRKVAEVRQRAEEGRARRREAPRREGETQQRHEMIPPLIGSPQECAERLAEFKEAGVQAVFVRPVEQHEEQIHVFMNEVAPLLK